MRSSEFVRAFTTAERRFVVLTSSAEASRLAVGEFAPAGGIGPPPSVPATSCVLVLMFDSRASRFVVNATAADSASCLALKQLQCFIVQLRPLQVMVNQ